MQLAKSTTGKQVATQKKGTRYEVYNEGYASLCIEKNAKWLYPCVHFHVLFKAKFTDALKYGANGLHFAEHILWNIVREEYELSNSNASTFYNGDMSLYGEAPSHDYEKALGALFKGMNRVATKVITPYMRRRYILEQKRITSETIDGWSEYIMNPYYGMFIFNPDTINNDYPEDYMWNVLLEESRLVRILIIAHCDIDRKGIDLFHKLAKRFTKLWGERDKRVTKPRLPMFHAPPISYITNNSYKEPMKLVPLESIENPIIRTIVGGSIGAASAYVVDTITNASSLKDTQIFDDALWMLDQSWRFYPAPLLVSIDSKTPLQAEWIEELYNVEKKELIKRYKKKAKLALTKVVRMAVDLPPI